MTELVSDLVLQTARRSPDAPALKYGDRQMTYGELATEVERIAYGLVSLGIGRSERVAIYLEKRLESVIGMFAAANSGAVFVPINPLLKPHQVLHILKDCNVRCLITSSARFAGLSEGVQSCHDLNTVVFVDADDADDIPSHVACAGWSELADKTNVAGALHRVIDHDMASIVYTSGSTGLPKGVVLSHRNIVAGAHSVSSYLQNVPEDRILSVLPLSFDAGMSQLTTAFCAGANAILMNYLLPRDVIKLAAAERVTGIAGVPPLWNQLAELDWPEDAARSIRYFTNTGGHMPRTTLQKLRSSLPNAAPYLMYGLTEAFRSTYLPPSEVDRRPDSIGKAIPNAEILVVREDGSQCAPGEPGELVHRGALVSLGYWNDPERTAERFKPAPNQDPALPHPELAVWSGDTVRADEEGFLYFVGRRDDMIKSSGYRVSPTEIEEVIYASGIVSEAVAIGIPHNALGQAVVIVATPIEGKPVDRDAVIAICRKELPAYMVPAEIVEQPSLPRNPNGKIDRRELVSSYSKMFTDETA